VAILDVEAVAAEIAKALEDDRGLQVNIHNVESLDYAIEAVERISGRGSTAKINTQPSCWVVTATQGKAEVAFFVKKETAVGSPFA